MYNTRIKYYPNVTTGGVLPVEIMVFNQPLFAPCTLMCKAHQSARGNTSDIDTALDGQASYDPIKYYRRVRKNVYDIISCNPDMSMFVTLTFDASVINRYSYSDIIRKLNVWLDNRVRRNGLKYLLVPEYHKDGAIHFHGVMKDSSLKLVNSGKRHKNKTIYNITDFPYGFTTAKRLGGKDHDIQAVAGYVTKYMTKTLIDYENGKDVSLKIGGRYYLSGGELQRPTFLYTSIPLPNDGGYVVDIPDLKLTGRIYTPADDLTTQLTFSSLLNTCRESGLFGGT